MLKYDVVIVGGGTAGVSCAYNAANNGLKTLVIEKNSFLGGSITSSLVIPAMKTSKNSINNDFFNELFYVLKEMNGAIEYCDGNKGWFNPELTKIALDQMLSSVGVDIKFEACANKINFIDDKISISIETSDTNNTISYNNLSECIETRYLVDATGDAKICEKLNCEFLKNEKENFQPSNLRFIMSGVDTKAFSDWIMALDTDRNVTTSCVIDGNTYVSTAYTWDTNRKWALKPLFEQAIANGELTEDDSNYFQLFSVAGTPDSIAFNAPRILEPIVSRSDTYVNARASIYRLSEFCRMYLIGFEKAHISQIADNIGTRVSKRVKGKYVYKIDDLINGTKFEHPVVISDYPVDIHSSKKNSSELQQYQEYQLPLETLMVDGYNNFFVIGRCISADFKSQAALRIIPSCFSMGEGLAKYLASLN